MLPSRMMDRLIRDTQGGLRLDATEPIRPELGDDRLSDKSASALRMGLAKNDPISLQDLSDALLSNSILGPDLGQGRGWDD